MTTASKMFQQCHLFYQRMTASLSLFAKSFTNKGKCPQNNFFRRLEGGHYATRLFLNNKATPIKLSR